MKLLIEFITLTYKDYNNFIFLWPASMIFLVICSAFLYILASSNTTFFWCSFLFLMPLLYQQKKVRWVHGFLWGILVFGVHFAWIFQLIITKSSSVWWIGAWILLILWNGTLSSAWFLLFKKNPIISTTIFFVILQKYSLCIATMNCGYPLLNPLLYLPATCWYFLPWFGETGLLFCLFALQVWIFNLIRKVSWLNGLKVLLCSFVFIIGFGKQSDIVLFDHTMITVHPWWYGYNDPMYEGYRMAHDLCNAAQKNPKASCIILPESSFCWDIKEYQDFISIWSQSCFDIPFLFGGHCQQDEVTVNAIFLIKDGSIAYQYNKQHYMPCVEQSLWIERVCKRSILSKEIIHNSAVIPMQDDTIVLGDIMYQVFICSEFFCQSKKIKGLPILLLWNDSWLCNDFTKHLAYRYIEYCEQKYRVSILHISTLGHTNI